MDPEMYVRSTPDGRSICVVIGCANCSRKFAGHRYICGPHWKGVSKATKRGHHQAHKHGMATGDWGPFGENWAKCELEAQERAAGI